MARKDESKKAKKELFQYLRTAHARYRDQNASVVYRSSQIVIDMCKLFQLYAPGRGIINDDPLMVDSLTDDVVDLITSSEKVWRKRQYKDVKLKYHNNYDVFVGVLLCDYFTTNYDLTSRWDRGVKTIFIRDDGSSSRLK
jgi:hypothetical protein